MRALHWLVVLLGLLSLGPAVGCLAHKHKCLPPSKSHLVYVTMGGSDTKGDGSECHPYASISHAISTITDATESDEYTVKVGPGNYTDPKGFWDLIPFVYVLGDVSRQTQIIDTNVGLAQSIASTTGAFAGMENLFFNGTNQVVNYTLSPVGLTGSHNVFTTNCIYGGTFVFNSPNSDVQMFSRGCTYHLPLSLTGGIGVFNGDPLIFAGMTVTAQGGQTTYEFDSLALRPTKTPNIVTLNGADSPLTVALGNVAWNSAGTLVLTGEVQLTTNTLPVVSRTQLNGNVPAHTIDAYSFDYTPSNAAQVWTAPLVTIQNALDDTQRSRSGIYTPTLTLAGATSASIKSVTSVASFYELNGNVVTVYGTAQAASALIVTGTTFTLTVSNPVTVNPAIQNIGTPSAGQPVPGYTGLNAAGASPVLYNSVILAGGTDVALQYTVSSPGTVLPSGSAFEWNFQYSLV